MINSKENDVHVPYWPESRSAIWWIAALSALPVVTALLSFRVDGEFAFCQLIARQFWVPSQLFEIATIVFAFSRGCAVQKEWAWLGGTVKSLVALWLLPACDGLCRDTEHRRSQPHFLDHSFLICGIRPVSFSALA